MAKVQAELALYLEHQSPRLKNIISTYHARGKVKSIYFNITVGYVINIVYFKNRHVVFLWPL